MPRALPNENTDAALFGNQGDELEANNIAASKLCCVRSSDHLLKKNRRSGAFARLKLRLMSSAATAIAFSSAALISTNAAAQQNTNAFLSGLGSVEILMVASFGGAMSFALLAASWMIRERTRIIGENAALNSRLVDIKAQLERLDALVNTDDQRIVVWDGKSEKPVLVGNLSDNSGAPEKRGNFLAFGTWLTPTSSAQFENFIKELRVSAKSFDLVVETKGGGVLEVQGRTSGGHAFVRFIELSEERKSNAQMELSHTRLKSKFGAVQKLFDAMQSPVWLRKEDGKLDWVNKAYANAVEVEEPKEAIENGLELFDQNERKKIYTGQIEGNSFAGELPAVISGDRKTLEVYDAVSGASRAGLAIDRSDISSLKKTVKHIEEGHAKMLDQLASAVAIFDANRHLRFYNSSFQKLWGLKTQFLDSGPSHSDMIDAMRSNHKLPEQPDWKKWREQQTEVYQSLEPIEDWWYLPDGQTLRVFASPQAQGGASWIFENVTEKLALESNYNSLVRMQGETLDHLSEAVAVFGSDGNLRLSNPALNQLWNIDAKMEITPDLDIHHISNLLDSWKHNLMDDEDAAIIHQKITGFDEQRSTETGRLELVGERFVDYTLVPMPEGQTMLTMIDTSASVNIERALKERAEALEESDHIKSKFLQHVSYELRAPLTTIAGFGEMLTSPEIGALNTKQSEYLDHINSSSDTLRAIIDDILDLATIDAGAMELDFDRIDLKDCIEQSAQGLQHEMDARSITIAQEIHPTCESLVADPTRLKQILQNLISNAITHSPDGGKILIAAQTNDGFSEIVIEDEGEGIPEQAKARIFDRFESGLTTKGHKGTGLGLSIVKSFVELHGGEIEVTNAKPRGARIMCRFPSDPIITSQAAE